MAAVVRNQKAQVRPTLLRLLPCVWTSRDGSGSGDFYGTVGGKTPYIPQGGSEVKKTKDNVRRCPRPLPTLALASFQPLAVFLRF